MRTIVIADLYGLGGLATSPGMLTLAQKIKALGANFVVLGPYDQDYWQQAAADLAKRPATDVLAAIGYSLGANNIVKIAAQLRARAAYIGGVQPSYWGAGVGWGAVIALPPQLAFARCIYNPSFAATGGLGYARYAAPAGLKGVLKLTTTVDLHPEVDNDAGVHGLILNDLKALAA